MTDLRALLKKLGDFRWIGKIASIFLFAGALWMGHRVLKSQDPNAIRNAFAQTSVNSIFFASMATAGAFFFLMLLDRLALSTRGLTLKWKQLAMSATVANALGNTLGMSAVTAGAVRWRFYSRWNLDGKVVALVGGLSSISIWLGFCLAFGISLFFAPPSLPMASGWFPFAGGVALLGLTAYFMACLTQRKIQLLRWKLDFPNVKIALQQVVVGCLEWVCFAAAFRALLPADLAISFPQLLQIFCLAQLAGIVSQVPGGLGVFDSALLWLLSSATPGVELVGPLLLFRAIFYVFPLLFGGITLAIFEYWHRRAEIARIKEATQNYASGIVPFVFATLAFASGVVLLFLGAAPRAQLGWLEPYLLLPVVEVSHFLASLAGLALLYLAWGLSRRLDAAYLMTLGTLLFGVIASLFMGIAPSAISGLILELVILIPSRRYFYRKTSLLQTPLSLDWIIAIVLVLTGTYWLGNFAYINDDISTDLWWKFAISGDAPRFYRSMVGVAVVAILFGLYRLLRVTQPHPGELGTIDLSLVDEIVKASPSSHAKLAYLGDKSFLLSKSQKALLMYAVQGRSWVVMGDPVGPVEEWPDLIFQFMEKCRRYTARPVFYQVQPEFLHLYLDHGMSIAKIGEEALVPLKDFNLAGGARQKIRNTLKKCEKDGLAFEVLQPSDAAECMAHFRAISDEWLSSKNAAEKSFSLGSFNEDYLRNFPFAIAKLQGEIVAFSNLWIGAKKRELSPDLIRYSSKAPPGVMDFLFIQMILWGQKEGFDSFSLGMAPLSGMKQQRFAPLWHRLGRLVFRYGEHFYNFQGLRKFKDKFGPEWRPIYIAMPNRMRFPKVLKDLVLLVGGGPMSILKK